VLTAAALLTHTVVHAATPDNHRASRSVPPPTSAAELARLAPATPEQILAAEQVLYGRYVCDDKYEVHVERNLTAAHYVNVRHQRRTWVMRPVASRSGAVRLEDTRGKVLLVQIPFKSMLLNTQTGERIVDACQHDMQRQASQEATRAGALAESVAP